MTPILATMEACHDCGHAINGGYVGCDGIRRCGPCTDRANYPREDHGHNGCLHGGP